MLINFRVIHKVTTHTQLSDIVQVKLCYRTYLCICAQNLQVPRFSQPFALLFDSSLTQQCWNEHYKVHTQWISLFYDSRSQQTAEQRPFFQDAFVFSFLFQIKEQKTDAEKNLQIVVHTIFSFGLELTDFLENNCGFSNCIFIQFFMRQIGWWKLIL